MKWAKMIEKVCAYNLSGLGFRLVTQLNKQLKLCEKYIVAIET